jgi:hypothetical protein
MTVELVTSRIYHLTNELWLRSELDKGIHKLESANITRKLAEIGAGQHF